MVRALTLNRVSFFGPLLPEPGSFFRLAGRAVALATVLAVKLVAVLAMSLEGITSRYCARVYESVLPAGYHAKMRRLHAVSVLTNMVDNHTLLDVPGVDVVGDAMRPPVFLAKIERSIAVSIKRGLPKVAAVFLPIINPFSVKSLKFLIRYIHVPIVPYTPMRSKGV